MDVPRLPDPVARAYAGALHAVALADRELGAAESARLDQLLERRCPGVDREDLFFERPTPEAFAAAVRGHAAAERAAIGLAFVADAVELGTVDGELTSAEAHAILRVARCFGLTLTEVGGVTNALDEWLGSLS